MTYLPDFHRVMADHYASRLQEVIAAGKQHTPEYYFVRNSLNYYKKQL